MKLKVSNEIVENYPALLIGTVIGRGVKNRQSDPELTAFMRDTEKKLRDSELSPEGLLENPFISAWRDTYLSFGVKSKSVRKDPPTAENTIRYILNGNEMREINAVVNAYLSVELECFLPIGGYDLDKIEGDIILRSSPGGETFIPPNGANRQTKAGEVVYSDESRVLTYRWNKMDCGATQILAETKNLVLCIESADDRIDRESLEKATKRLREVLEKYCPGNYTDFIADVNECSEWEL